MNEIKKVLLIGDGRDLSLAIEFRARDLETYYYTEWDGKGPRMDASMVGFGWDRFGLHLVKDFYSLLKTIKLKEEWLVVITNPRLGDLSSWLRENDFIVFGPGKYGNDLGNDLDKAHSFFADYGQQLGARYVCSTITEVEAWLIKNGQEQKTYTLNMKADHDFLTPPATAAEFLKQLNNLNDSQRNAPLGYVLEDYFGGVDIKLLAFFNGSEFLYPAMLCYKTIGGGYLEWREEHPLFQHLQLLQPGLQQMDYHGVVGLFGSVVRKGAWGDDQPATSLLLARSLDTTPGFPEAGVYFKTIQNLGEVLTACALGEKSEIKLLSQSAYWLTVFPKTPSLGDESIWLGKLYEHEKEHSELYGLVYGRVIMDREGAVFSLPGTVDLFHAAGLGKDYFAAVKNCLSLLDICMDELELENRASEVIKEIRDRIIFSESWL